MDQYFYDVRIFPLTLGSKWTQEQHDQMLETIREYNDAGYRIHTFTPIPGKTSPNVDGEIFELIDYHILFEKKSKPETKTSMK